jgi:DNA-binding IclR family transcriptional regulator
VLLAYAPPEVQALVLSRLERITPYTITQPGSLHAQLVRVRARGFAQTNEEMSLGACSVAVPVRSGDGEVVAAVGIVVADLRRDRMRLVAALQVAASGNGRSISGRAFH